MIGSAARVSTTQNATMKAAPATPRAMIVDDPHAYWVPPHVVSRIMAVTPADKQRDTKPVDLVMDPPRRDVKNGRDDEESDDPDRHVDVEDPSPREVLREPSSGKWAEDARQPEHSAEVAHVAPPLTRRHDVADDRLGADHQPTGADALDGSACDQVDHVLRKPGEHRARQEDDDRKLEELLSSVEVAELSPQRRGDRRREQVSGDDPRKVVEAVQVGCDRRERRGDDGLIERCEEHSEHERAEDHEYPAVLCLGELVVILRNGGGSDLRQLSCHEHPPSRGPARPRTVRAAVRNRPGPLRSSPLANGRARPSAP